ncbi:hypothetical protein [Streptomyces sp. NPDC058155]|uniref:hypothetical protein n=1 Tax=Streptomyces sp. NPDC058155 TaxID=3346359 RepID=UPI0036DFCBED
MGAGEADVVRRSRSSLVHSDVYAILGILKRSVVENPGRVNLIQITSSSKGSFDLFKERVTGHR